MCLRKFEGAKNLSDGVSDCVPGYIIIRLQNMANENYGLWTSQNPHSSKREFRKQFEAEVISQLSLFKSLDPELEKYITCGKFLDFEKKHYCRNYFVLSSIPLDCDSCDFNSDKCNRCCSFQLKSGRYKVLGFFSLAGKTIHLMNFESKKKLCRMVYRSSASLDYAESYLIGHLSKNYFNGYDSEISGDTLFLRIIQLIRHFHSFFGINVIRVDCSADNLSVLKFYERHGFYVLAPVRSSIPASPNASVLEKHHIAGPSKNLVMMIRKVN